MKLFADVFLLLSIISKLTLDVVSLCVMDASGFTATGDFLFSHADQFFHLVLVLLPGLTDDTLLRQK